MQELKNTKKDSTWLTHTLALLHLTTWLSFILNAKSWIFSNIIYFIIIHFEKTPRSLPINLHNNLTIQLLLQWWIYEEYPWNSGTESLKLQVLSIIWNKFRTHLMKFLIVECLCFYKSSRKMYQNSNHFHMLAVCKKSRRAYLEDNYYFFQRNLWSWIILMKAFIKYEKHSLLASC